MEDAEKKSIVVNNSPRIPPHLCRLLLVLDNELVSKMQVVGFKFVYLTKNRMF